MSLLITSSYAERVKDARCNLSEAECIFLDLTGYDSFPSLTVASGSCFWAYYYFSLNWLFLVMPLRFTGLQEPSGGEWCNLKSNNVTGSRSITQI